MTSIALDRVSVRYGQHEILSNVTVPTIEGIALTALVGANVTDKLACSGVVAGQLRGPGSVRLSGAENADLRSMPQGPSMTAVLTVYKPTIVALKQGARGRLTARDFRCCRLARPVRCNVSCRAVILRTLGASIDGRSRSRKHW